MTAFHSGKCFFFLFHLVVYLQEPMLHFKHFSVCMWSFCSYKTHSFQLNTRTTGFSRMKQVKKILLCKKIQNVIVIWVSTSVAIICLSLYSNAFYIYGKTQTESIHSNTWIVTIYCMVAGLTSECTVLLLRVFYRDVHTTIRWFFPFYSNILYSFQKLHLEL